MQGIEDLSAGLVDIVKIALAQDSESRQSATIRNIQVIRRLPGITGIYGVLQRMPPLQDAGVDPRVGSIGCHLPRPDLVVNTVDTQPQRIPAVGVPLQLFLY